MKTRTPMNFDFKMSIRDQGGGMLCNAETGNGYFTVSMEFAKEIQRRWNSHDELLAAFQEGKDGI